MRTVGLDGLEFDLVHTDGDQESQQIPWKLEWKQGAQGGSTDKKDWEQKQGHTKRSKEEPGD